MIRAHRRRDMSCLQYDTLRDEIVFFKFRQVSNKAPDEKDTNDANCEEMLDKTKFLELEAKLLEEYSRTQDSFGRPAPAAWNCARRRKAVIGIHLGTFSDACHGCMYKLQRVTNFRFVCKPLM